MEYKIKPIEWKEWEYNICEASTVIGYFYIRKLRKLWELCSVLAHGNLPDKKFKTKQKAIDYANKFYIKRLLPALEAVE